MPHHINITLHFIILCYTVLKLLHHHHLLPLPVIHVEHCCNCELHQTTTRHVPGSYEKLVTDLYTQSKSLLPPSLLYHNHKKVIGSTRPRVGSFEVCIQPYLSPYPMLISSKLKERGFPRLDDLLHRLSAMMHPPVTNFQDNDMPTLDVIVLDSLNR